MNTGHSIRTALVLANMHLSHRTKAHKAVMDALASICGDKPGTGTSNHIIRAMSLVTLPSDLSGHKAMRYLAVALTLSGGIAAASRDVDRAAAMP